MIKEGWSYIGQTIVDVNQRWRNGDGYKNCCMFYNAIKKYGWDNFTHEIIENNIPLDKLDEREAYWIQYYHTYVEDPECKGYNLTAGGLTGGTKSEQTKKKISNSLMGHYVSEECTRKRLETRNKWSEEQKEELRRNLSKSHKGQISAMKGRHHSEETKKKLSQCHHNFKPIKCVETGETFNSVNEASDKLHLCPSAISDRTNHPEKFKSGYHFVRIDEHD